MSNVRKGEGLEKMINVVFWNSEHQTDMRMVKKRGISRMKNKFHIREDSIKKDENFLKHIFLAMIIGFVMSAIGIGGWVDSAFAKPVVLRMHSQIVEARPEAKYLQEFADRVNERAKGKLNLIVYHAGSLGLRDPDLLRILKRGDVDMAMLYGEYFARDAPELAAVYVQGAITKPEQHLKLLPVIRQIYEEAYSEWDILTIGGIVSPVFDVGLHCKTPVNTLDELKTKKLRVWAPHLVHTFQDLGVAAQVIGQNDMYTALQTGVVDCAYYLSTVAETVSLQEVTKYEAYLHPWAAVPWMFGVSERAWKRLTPELQQILTEEAEATWEKTRDLAVDEVREAEARSYRQEKLGITMLDRFSDADLQKFVDAANNRWMEMAETAGKKGIEYYDRMQDAINKLD
jgi:TRAP-type C4-dicarboxylate transport system substrate-binding protein